MSVRDKAYNYVGGRGSGRSVTIGGGNTVISGGQHKLDGPEHLAPDDTTTLDASASRHGLLPKLPGDAAYRLTGTGVWVPKVLADNTDVSSATPTDQDVLTWDDYLQEWVPQAAAGGALDYEDLTDVDMTGITDGQIPVWDAYAGVWLPGDASGVTDILDLPTAETDTSLRLAPDGAGGVEFAAGGGGGGALVLLEQHTASTSATLDFTSFISSTYDEYLFELISIQPDTNAVDFYIRVSVGGTWDTGSNYVNNHYLQATSGNVAVVVTTSSLKVRNNGEIYGGSGRSGVGGSLRLLDPQSTTVYKQFLGDIVWTGNTNWVRDVFNGIWKTYGSAVDGVRFYFSSGNIASGTIRAYGIAKT